MYEARHLIHNPQREAGYRNQGKCMGMTTRLTRIAAVASICTVVFCIANVPMFAASAPSRAASVPVITTVAGGGAPTTGYGDGGPATSATFNNLMDVARDAAGNLYIAEGYGMRVRKVNAAGTISTVAGNGTQVYNGDGIPATSAAIDVRGIAVAPDGTLYIADGTNGRIRKVGADGIIRTLALMEFPTALAVGPGGVLYVVGWHRIWKVSAAGSVSAFAGDGEYGFAGDGGPATSARFANPEDIAVDRWGNVFVADSINDRIRRIDTSGVITTVAGGGHFRNDPATLNSTLSRPRGVAADSRGNLYVVTNGLVRMVNRDGIIRSVVGSFDDSSFGEVGGPSGFAGDGGPASQASLHDPLALALDAQENLYIADSRNERIRKVTAIPTPRTPAGGNAFGPHVTRPVGSFAQHVAVADVTGDGRVDALLTTTSWSGPYADPDKDFRLWLFVQQADGTLAPPLKYSYFGDMTGGRSGSGLATGDLNKDGYADVVLGTLNGIQVYLGRAGGLSPGIRYDGVTDAQPTLELALLDVNRDGKLDVSTLSAGRQEGGTSPNDKVGMIVFYGNGAGGFSSKAFTPRPADDSWKFLRATDVNGDGLLDLTSAWSAAIAGYPSGGVEIRRHNGSGGFASTTRLRVAAAQWLGDAYAFGDFNSDGRKDVVVSRSGNVPDAHYAQWLQRADGGFQEFRMWKAFDGPADMVSADMNNDGKDDLLVLHGGWSSVGYQQQVAGGLEEEFKYYTLQSGNPRSPSIAVGDLNNDGCRDIALADYNHGLIVLPGQRCLRRSNDSQPRVPPRGSGVLHVGQQRQSTQVALDEVRGEGDGTGPGTQVTSWPGRATTAVAAVARSAGWGGTSLFVLLVALLGFGLAWWKFWR